ncbi:MAG: TadA family conjugal transfer-associated ATPase [Propionibacteriaceae bacterium]|nr:TadA family conjugal transfer-associated ATPase [Propionibacteriaceae bacterium]
MNIEDLREQLVAQGQEISAPAIAAALRKHGELVSEASVREAVEALKRESQGAGPLDVYLADPLVTDVLVNGPSEVYIDRGSGLEKVDFRFSSDQEVRKLAVRLAAAVGRRLDEGSPFVDCRLASGVRVHAILGSLTDVGTCISLRAPRRVRLTVDDWVASGSMSEVAAQVLRAVIAAKRAFLVSGGTGTGKTTLLGALLAEVPDEERLVVVEDSRELDPGHPHCVRMESRPANVEGVGAIPMTLLVKQALRMRPDRLVVGEVRGPELVDMLLALNTGHEGGCGTVHANSASDVPARLEALGGLAGLGRVALHSQMASALDILVHLRREADGRRRVAEINTICVGDDGICASLPALEFTAFGTVLQGEGFARLEAML